MSDPNRVVLAGDWHGNARWACHVIEQSAKLLADEDIRVILHAGDFGFWPGQDGEDYLYEVCEALEDWDLEVLFVDGNHEWHPELLTLLAEDDKNWSGPNDIAVPVGRDAEGMVRVSWIPRGHRWRWHHKTWMGLGGAVSVDKAERKRRGYGWWPEETFTGEQLDHARRPGKVDVMLTHDVPAAVPLDFGRPPSFWDPLDIARSDAHRNQLQDVVDVLQPKVLIHGHAHRVVRTSIPPYGTEVIGLDMDGTDGNYTLFDTRTLKEVPVS
jgi:hypothetical protein